jgi:diadenosine tetraphosphate (Ap4A) HIT family hydrolase
MMSATVGKNMNDSCLFCGHLNSLEIVFDDDRAAVALHDDWAVRGHTMVIWKSHVENISQLNEEELAHFWRVYQRAERALLEVTGADRAIMLKLGIVTPHLHLHIYPVSAALDRGAVMDIIEGRVREVRDEGFVGALERRIQAGRSRGL